MQIDEADTAKQHIEARTKVHALLGSRRRVTLVNREQWLCAEASERRSFFAKRALGLETELNLPCVRNVDHRRVTACRGSEHPTTAGHGASTILVACCNCRWPLLSLLW